MSAHLVDGSTVAIEERRYLTRPDGETVLVGVRTPRGFVKASDVEFIG